MADMILEREILGTRTTTLAALVMPLTAGDGGLTGSGSAGERAETLGGFVGRIRVNRSTQRKVG